MSRHSIRFFSGREHGTKISNGCQGHVHIQFLFMNDGYCEAVMVCVFLIYTYLSRLMMIL